MVSYSLRIALSLDIYLRFCLVMNASLSGGKEDPIVTPLDMPLGLQEEVPIQVYTAFN